MTIKRGNRASALIVPYPDTVTETPLRIVPETAGAGTKHSPPAAKNRKSKQAKTLGKKKSTPKKPNAQKPKLAADRAAKVKVEARHRTGKMAPSATESARPRLVPLEATSLVVNSGDPASTTNTAFVPPVAPVVVMTDQTAEEATFTTCSGICLDGNPEELCVSTESEVFATNESIAGPAPVSAIEKPTFLQALALQWTSLWHMLTRTWTWTQQKLKSAQVRKRLRVCETVSLGEKRFIAVIQVDGEQFLVGGSSNSVSTLAHLEPRPEFSDVYRRCEQGVSQA